MPYKCKEVSQHPAWSIWVIRWVGKTDIAIIGFGAVEEARLITLQRGYLPVDLPI